MNQQNKIEAALEFLKQYRTMGETWQCVNDDNFLKAVTTIETALKGDWLPIETAPKDGTKVLLHRPDHIIPVCEGWFENGYIKTHNWRCYDGSSYGMPTHWMPLPTPPTEGE